MENNNINVIDFSPLKTGRPRKYATDEESKVENRKKARENYYKRRTQILATKKEQYHSSKNKKTQTQ